MSGDWKRGMQRAIEIVKEQQRIFGLETYAINQPSSSIGERFACGMCITAIETDIRKVDELQQRVKRNKSK